MFCKKCVVILIHGDSAKLNVRADDPDELSRIGEFSWYVFELVKRWRCFRMALREFLNKNKIYSEIAASTALIFMSIVVGVSANRIAKRSNELLSSQMYPFIRVDHNQHYSESEGRFMRIRSLYTSTKGLRAMLALIGSLFLR